MARNDSARVSVPGPRKIGTDDYAEGTAYYRLPSKNEAARFQEARPLVPTPYEPQPAEGEPRSVGIDPAYDFGPDPDKGMVLELPPAQFQSTSRTMPQVSGKLYAPDGTLVPRDLAEYGAKPGQSSTMKEAMARRWETMHQNEADEKGGKSGGSPLVERQSAARLAHTVSETAAAATAGAGALNILRSPRQPIVPALSVASTAAGMFAGAGALTAGRQAEDMIDTMRATGATWDDLRSAVKEVLMTRRGWSNIGKGVAGSLMDMANLMSFGHLPRGDRMRETMEDAKGGDAGQGVSPAPGEEVPSVSPPAGDGPRIVINPSTFRNDKDALCVAFNEAFRLVMEEMKFDPVSEPTQAQRRFFADTAYADDETQLRRTILARICTFDTSVKDPTDEQIQEAQEFLEDVMEAGFPQTKWEQSAVQRIHDVIARVPVRGGRRPQAPEEPGETEETPEAEESLAAMKGGDADQVHADQDGGDTRKKQSEDEQRAQAEHDQSQENLGVGQTLTGETQALQAGQRNVTNMAQAQADSLKQAYGAPAEDSASPEPLDAQRSAQEAGVQSEINKAGEEVTADLEKERIAGIVSGVDDVIARSYEASKAAKAEVAGLHEAQASLTRARQSMNRSLSRLEASVEREMNRPAVDRAEAEVQGNIAAAAAEIDSDLEAENQQEARNALAGTTWKNGDVTYSYDGNGGSTTYDASTGRIVFAQPDRQGQAIADAGQHVAKAFAPRPKFSEATVGGQPAQRTSPAMAAPARSGLAGPTLQKEKGGGWTDIQGNWHKGPKSGILGKRQTTLGRQTVLGGAQTVLGGTQTVLGGERTTLASRMSKGRKKNSGYRFWSG